MKSSTGAHFIALDHVRALAAFLVFTFHFIHGNDNFPVLSDCAPAVFPLCLLDEGHTGVALFMTLSGYLFAKLLEGKTVDYKRFFWNRMLRLFPLLLLVVLAVGVNACTHGASWRKYLLQIMTGALLPSLPNGGWSITVECHFYVFLPLFLWLLRKSKLLPLTIVFAAISLRAFLYHRYGTIQNLAYFTLIGRIDQFVLGMLACQFRARFARRHVLSLAVITAFVVFYWYFDWRGGFMHYPSFPSVYPLWIILPTLEGVAYAVGIAWYDNSFAPPDTGVSRFLGRLGVYSYSIYLLHFFVVYREAGFVNKRIMPISNFYLACLWATACFLLMMPVGYLSFRFIEAPFLRLRRRYVVAPNPG